MARNWLISRRTALKGLGASLALPLLDVMGWADPPPGAAASKPPVRLGFLNVPCGLVAANFWPKGDSLSAAGELPSTLEPLRGVLQDCLILGGLDNNPPRLDNVHASEVAGWLTCVPLRGSKNDGVVGAATSADQLAAQVLGKSTSLPSLEISLGESHSGCCDAGFDKLYPSTLSWSSATQPNPQETNPRAVFNRLFSSRQSLRRRINVPQPAAAPAGDAAPAAPVGAGSQDPSLDQSMLDLVRENAKSFARRISADDQQKLEQYLEAIRSLEKRIVAIERQQGEAAQEAQSRQSGKRGYASSPPITVTIGSPARYDERVRLMGDLMILAFQTDVTRVCTFAFSISQPWTLSYPELGFTDEHHGLSHWNDEPSKPAKLAKVERYETEQFAYLVSRMKGLKEGAGTLLDSCILTYGSGMGDGLNHTLTNLPTIVAGRGGGVRPGRYVKKCQGVFADLLMGVLARAGCPQKVALGNATKELAELG